MKCLEDNHLWDRPSHPRRRCASLKARFRRYEGIGIVEEVGDAVDIQVGDKVIISCVTACNAPATTTINVVLPSHCEDGGLDFGS